MARSQVQIKADYTPEFEQFWTHYPRRQNSDGRWVREGKHDAFVIWRLMCEEDRKHAMYAVLIYEQSRPKLPKDAWRWLQNRRYDDWDMPEEEGQHLPAEFTDTIKRVENPQVDTNERRTANLRALQAARARARAE